MSRRTKNLGTKTLDLGSPAPKGFDLIAQGRVLAHPGEECEHATPTPKGLDQPVSQTTMQPLWGSRGGAPVRYDTRDTNTRNLLNHDIAAKTPRPQNRPEPRTIGPGIGYFQRIRMWYMVQWAK